MDYQVKKDLLHIMHSTVSVISKNTYTHTHRETLSRDIQLLIHIYMDFPGGLVVKNLPANAGKM